MSSVEQLTLVAIAESAQSAATRAGLGDAPGAKDALDRAEARLTLFVTGRAPHERNVRLATEAVSRARRAVEVMGTNTHTAREKYAEVRAASRAVARAKA